MGRKQGGSANSNNLLPKNVDEFAEPEYWEKFNKRTNNFEWYGSFADLRQNLSRYLKPSYKYLQIGCGNSNLASDMYDEGFKDIMSIDIDEKSIKLQRTKNSKRSGLSFEQCSVDKISAGDKSFNVVIDKGTLDALMPKSSIKITGEDLVKSYFDEVVRVLKPFGLFLVVTLAQEQIIKFVSSYFSERHLTQPFLVRIEKVEYTTEKQRKRNIGYPVYLIVLTKLLKPVNAEDQYIEYIPTKLVGPAVKCRSVGELMDHMLTDRQLQYFIEVCATQKLNREYSMVLYNGETGAPRFNICIYDDPDVHKVKKYAIFVVPFERANEYLFDCVEGRQELLKSVAMDRLCMVKLYKNEKYGSTETLRDELGSFAFNLRPFYCNDESIQILSVGVDYVEKFVVVNGEGVNGPWEIQHVKFSDDLSVRRLVFTNIATVVQSEAKIIDCFNEPEKTVIDTKYLSCEHHQMMLGSILFLKQFPNVGHLKLEANFCVLGLGGGLLTTFLHDVFPKATVTAVDIDSNVFEIASKYFAMPADSPRITLVQDDALKYIEEYPFSKSFKPFDVIFVDISGDYQVDGLVCPPAPFAKRSVFEAMKRCLTPEGVLTVNVVSRSKLSRHNVFKEFKEIFQSQHLLKRQEDINEIMIGTDATNGKATFVESLANPSKISSWNTVKPGELMEFPRLK
uniref:Methyltranfer_dom domain-containing protein n=1 Tax=Steinernema glaseri TaxID=37863 RepID=A0A1I7YYS4_9BILA